jgi:hypothetical protein
MSRSSCSLAGSVGLIAASVLVLVPASPGVAAAPCVGEAEYNLIHAGMTIQKLGKVLDDQVPFATSDGRGNQHYRWYDACEAWQPDRDVVVRYHQAAVGRRTVTRKALKVYVPVTPRQR